VGKHHPARWALSTVHLQSAPQCFSDKQVIVIDSASVAAVKNVVNRHRQRNTIAIKIAVLWFSMRVPTAQLTATMAKSCVQVDRLPSCCIYGRLTHPVYSPPAFWCLRWRVESVWCLLLVLISFHNDRSTPFSRRSQVKPFSSSDTTLKQYLWLLQIFMFYAFLLRNKVKTR